MLVLCVGGVDEVWTSYFGKGCRGLQAGIIGNLEVWKGFAKWMLLGPWHEKPPNRQSVWGDRVSL